MAGARRITAVLPLLPYARFVGLEMFLGLMLEIFFRGDHKQPDKRKPIAAKLIAGMLEVSGVHQVITVDIHSPQTEGFFSIPVDCLTARFLFERFEAVYTGKICIVETDRIVINDSAICCQKLHSSRVLDRMIYCDYCETLLRKSAIDGSTSGVGGTIIVQL